MIPEQDTFQQEELTANAMVNETPTSITHKIPRQQRMQLLQDLDASSMQLKFMKQIESEQLERFNKQAFDRFDNLKIYDYGKVFSFNKNNISKMSLLPLIRLIVIEQTKRLIQIQFQIDIFTKKFIKLPSQKYVHQFISQLLLVPDLKKMFTMIMQSQFKKPKMSEQPSNKIEVLRYFISPLLTFAMRILQRDFGYMIRIQALMMLLFSPLDDILLTSVEDIINYQSKQILDGYTEFIDRNKQRMESIEDYLKKTNSNISKNVRQIIYQYANSRHLVQKQTHFFSIVNQNDKLINLKEMKKKAYQQQQQKILNSIIVEQEDPRIQSLYQSALNISF